MAVRGLRGALCAAGLALAGQAAAAEPQELRLFNRPVVELRAPQGGLDPAERVSRAQRRFERPQGRAAPSPPPEGVKSSWGGPATT